MNGKLMNFVQNLYCRFQDDEVPAMGAQLTYYLILAVFPFLIFLIAVLSFTPISSDQVMSAISKIMPSTSFSTVNTVLSEIQASKSHALLSIGMIGTIWSASSGVDAIMRGLNKAYDEEETRPYWKVKGISLLSTLVLAVVILFTFGMLIFGAWIGQQIFKFFHLSMVFDVIWSIMKYVLPLVVMAGVFTFLYSFMPNRHLKIKSVIPGALFTTFGWIITSVLFSFYVNNFSNYTKTYGSLGGIIVLLTWLYISSIIIVLGGEINATLTFDKEGRSKDSCKKFALPLFKKKNKDNPNRKPDTIKPLYR